MAALKLELMKGARGDAVKQVQAALKRWGYHVPTDGHYGAGTQAAVRSFQKHKLLLPTGIVDQQTLEELNAERGKFILGPRNAEMRRYAPSLFNLLTSIEPAIFPLALSARCQPAIFEHSLPASALRLSEKGCKFICDRETLPGTSERLHHPSLDSGVTIGAGYDMKMRSAAQVVADLSAVGVELMAAMQAANGAGLPGKDAGLFVDGHKRLITLTVAQQVQLLKRVAPDYEAIVRRHVHIDLFQWEFDALVSFVYNPGGKFVPVADNLSAGRIDEAMRIIKRRTGTGSASAGLARRRTLEIALYLYGDYHDD